MSTHLAAALLALLAVAAWLDLRQRRIPNWTAAGVALIWLAAGAVGQRPDLLSSLLIGIGMLTAGMAVWRCGWLGGGDVKLVAALSLWAGPQDLPGLLVAIAVGGGLLALGIVLAGQLADSPVATMLRVRASHLLPPTLQLRAMPTRAASSLPYGVAVALGGCWLVHRQLT